MDDRTFDHKTAQEWIEGVEGGTNRIRDQDVYPILRAWVEHASPQQILEIGCGQGVCSDHIDLKGRRYTGVDPSPFMLERAKKLYESQSRRFLSGNAYDLPFPGGLFDGAFSVMVWHLLSDLGKAAAELSRVLKNAGHFLVITANPDSYSEWKELYTNAKLEGQRFEGDMKLTGDRVAHDVLYLHTLDDLSGSLRSAHLKIDRVEKFRKSKKGQGEEYLVSISGRKIID